MGLTLVSSYLKQLRLIVTDIESGSTMYYDDFVNALRNYTWYGSKYYYITAAPQYILSAKRLLNVSDVLIRMHTLAKRWTRRLSSMTLRFSFLIYSMLFIQVFQSRLTL